MPWTLSLDFDSYEAAREGFSWDLPADYNIAHDVLRKHDPEAVALHQAYPDGRRHTYSFGDLDARSDRVAAGLRALGVERGDRVAVVLPQVPENALTHLACWKLGAVTVPLSVLFGDEALRYRLSDSAARVVVADADIVDTVRSVAPDCPDLAHVVAVDWRDERDADGADDGTDDAVTAIDDDTDERPFAALPRPVDGSLDLAATDAGTPAIVLYTSGSTGPPKGVLHGHGLWLGHCPAFRMYFEHDIAEAVCWTPADWAWIGALGDLVYPAWHYGRPVVGYPMGSFDPARSFSLMAEFSVTHAFLPPTAIRMLMEVEAPAERYDLSLAAICSGGEPLTPEILTWADEALSGTVVNELYGQTEANLLVCNSQSWFEARPGSMGKPVPGHDVRVIDPETGAERPTGEVGEIAVRHDDDPVVFQEYWGEPAKTAASRIGDWHRTGDLGYEDEDGYLWFKARDDDLIVTSGYRVGPGEVERVILEHPDVEQVGVVGLPDERRGEVVAAFVQPVAGVTGDDALREAIQNRVRERLAKYEYPRRVEFVEALPTTTTGKIQRRELREGADADSGRGPDS